MFKKILGLVMVAAFFLCTSSLANEKAVVWDQKYDTEQIFFFEGDEEMGTTLDAAAAVDATGGIVTIPSTDHGYKVGSYVTLGATDSYNGTYEIVAVAANTFNIYATFVAETFAGTDTAKCSIVMDKAYKFKSFEIHLSLASATSENLTVTKDAEEGSAFDVLLYSVDMDGYQDIVYCFDPAISCEKGDKIVFEWSNTDNRIFGVTAVVRR